MNKTFQLPVGRRRASFVIVSSKDDVPCEQDSDCRSACGDSWNEPAGAWLWRLYSAGRTAGSGCVRELSRCSWS